MWFVSPQPQPGRAPVVLSFGVAADEFTVTSFSIVPRVRERSVIASLAVAIPFADLPGWPAATAPGHVGRLLIGRLDRTPVVMLQGRLHVYEGNDPGLVIQPEDGGNRDAPVSSRRHDGG